MREQKFKDWLEAYRQKNGKPLKQRSKEVYVIDNKKVAEVESRNLDDEFKKNGLESLIELYTYSKADRDRGRDNPTNLDINKSRLYKSLGNHKVVLNHYRRFCEKHPPK